MNISHRRATNQQGVTSVEYALVVGLVSLVIVAATVTLADRFTTWVTALANTVGSLLS
jgi:Flp pilus assembly pilin Flp